MWVQAMGEMNTDYTKEKFAQCIGCGYTMTMYCNNALKFNIDCPMCGALKQFGPTVYVEGFEGYSMDQIMEYVAQRNG